jgi:hypothetical protein
MTEAQGKDAIGLQQDRHPCHRLCTLFVTQVLPDRMAEDEIELVGLRGKLTETRQAAGNPPDLGRWMLCSCICQELGHGLNRYDTVPHRCQGNCVSSSTRADIKDPRAGIRE